MRKTLLVLATAASLTFGAGPALADHHSGNGDPGDCQSGGCGNDNRKCNNAQDRCSGSFSPQFDRSPVDIHDNTVCLPGSTCNVGSGNKDKNPPPQQGQQPQKYADGPPSVACLLSLPYHCDPPPKR